MPFVSIWNHWKNNLFFTILIMFWNITRIFFLAHKKLGAIVTLFFPDFLQSSFCDGKFIPFQLYLFIKGLLFVILRRSFWFLHNLTQLLQRIESIFDFFFIDRIYCCFFVFYPIRRIDIWSTSNRIYFMTLKYNNWT